MTNGAVAGPGATTADRPIAQSDGHEPTGDPNGQAAWTERTRLVLTPVPGPSILGLIGFGCATFMVATLLAGWWGDPAIDAPIIAPFALFIGGLAQLLAGMWSYKARDAVATAMHGTWGSFWLAWGLLVLLIAGGVLPASALTSRAFGFWFIVLGVVTVFGAVAALADSLGLFTVLGLLAAGSILLAVGFVSGVAGIVTVGGWVLVFAALAAFYTAGAMMLAEGTKGRTILPLGKFNANANIPGRTMMSPIEYSGGMPGAKVGQ